MGWGVTVNGVFLSKITLSQLQEKKREDEEIIQDCQMILLQLATATPREMPDGIEWEDHVRWKVQECLDDITEASAQLFVINQILEDPKGTTAKDT